MTKLTVRICGGLGNQLFQVFTLLSVARQQNIEYIIKREDSSPSITPRKTYWKDLIQNINLVDSIHDNYQVYKEHNSNIHQSFPTFTTDTILDGYFQSDKYIENIRKDLFNYIRLSDEDLKKVLITYQLLKSYNKSLIFVHVRRGDYIRLSYFHYNIPLSYYHKSLSEFDQDNNHFVFFSDDLQYCKTNFDYVKHKSFIDLEDYLSLYLMSLLDGGIIANSSFSWWGAYLLELRKELNQEETPIIIQPARWFTQGSILPNDRIMRKNNWKVIE